MKVCIDKKTGAPLQLREKETFQYVPIKKALKQFLEIPGVMNSILSNKDSEGDVLQSYRDGSYYKGKYEEGCEFPQVPLLLYNDEFETCNPLGSKRGKHKISAFYVSVIALPPKYQGRLDNILLVALVTNNNVVKHGIDGIVKFIKEVLEDLSQNGLTIDGIDYKGIVRPTLFQVLGDNLSIHGLLGYTMSFSANFYCRFCKGHRSVLQVQVAEDTNLLRNQDNYAADILVNNLSETGIKVSINSKSD